MRNRTYWSRHRAGPVLSYTGQYLMAQGNDNQAPGNRNAGARN